MCAIRDLQPRRLTFISAQLFIAMSNKMRTSMTHSRYSSNSTLHVDSLILLVS